MNKPILFIVSLCIFYSCTKVADNPVPSGEMFGSMNTTETSLLGTWYLDQQVVSHKQDKITYTGYSSNYNITFRYGLLAPDPQHAINCKNYVGAWLPNTVFVPQNTSTLPVYGGVKYTYRNNVPYYDSIHRNDFWYYSTASNMLDIFEIKSIISLSGSSLTVTWTNGDETIVSTLHQ